jgi:hypothetical protein
VSNKQNEWTRAKILELKTVLGGCQWPACTVTQPELLDFCHLDETPLLSRTRKANEKKQKQGKTSYWGSRSRGRKERLMDVRKWPGSYTLFCGDRAEDHHGAWDQMDSHDFRPHTLLQLAARKGYRYLMPPHPVQVEAEVTTRNKVSK